MSRTNPRVRPAQPRVLVAGAGGFIGSAERAIARDTRIVAGRDVEEALGRLREPIDAIICDPASEEAVMLRVRRRTDTARAEVPIICIYLEHIAQRYGRAVGDEVLRQLLRGRVGALKGGGRPAR
jgi:nucleoside-diphosphate-sugar epimerase